MSEEGMEKVITATLLPGAAPVLEGINNALLGFVLTSEHKQFKAYVKFVSEREVAVEIICAVLGRCLGLPIPEPVLVYDPIQKKTGFGSVAADHPNLIQWMRKEGQPAIVAHLEKWGKLIPAACFDEWIENADRHPGNLLFDGKDFFLIDHGAAIPNNTPSDQEIDNYLFGLALTFHDNEVARKRLERNAGQSISAYTVSLLKNTQALLPTWGYFSILNSCLTQRASYLASLIAGRIRPKAQIDLFSHEQPTKGIS